MYLGPVLVETAEDETAIQPIVQWDARTDQLTGFCGRKGGDHVCVSDCTVTVGDSYSDITEAFQDLQVGSLARVVMINPLHPLLPATPVHIAPTCNRFTSETVAQDWQIIQELYDKYLYPVLGPLVGECNYISFYDVKTCVMGERSVAFESNKFCNQIDNLLS